MRLLVGLSIAFCLGVLVPTGVAAQPYTYSYTTFDVPGATSTVALGINDLTEIVGSFNDATGGHGFLRKNGEITVIDFPGASSTHAASINNLGQIAGDYILNGQLYGFLLDNGAFTTINPPGALRSEANSINDLGQIAGQYTPPGPTTNFSRGFLWTHGHYLPIDPSAVPGTSSVLRGINRQGQLVGYFNEPNTGSRGFRMEANGDRTLIDVPGSSDIPQAINERGEIVGETLLGAARGYLLAFGLVVTTIGVPESVSTVPSDINNRAQIVGSYALAGTANISHAFVATPTGVVEDISGNPSDSGTRVPQATVIADADLRLWTLGPGQQILRDGIQVANGYGSQILWYQGSIYVLGDDYQWWRWSGATWEFFGPNDPSH
jgi:uncharacterized membrane protein